MVIYSLFMVESKNNLRKNIGIRNLERKLAVAFCLVLPLTYLGYYGHVRYAPRSTNTVILDTNLSESVYSIKTNQGFFRIEESFYNNNHNALRKVAESSIGKNVKIRYYGYSRTGFENSSNPVRNIIEIND